jgi:putative FmdB family regulatory protein
MPTYDYRCTACGHEFELFQSMRESPKRKCPQCGKAALERLIGTGAAVLFKGSGFYQTDYRSESYKKAAEAESKSASGTGSETKPAAKDAAAPASSSTDKTTKSPETSKPSSPTDGPGSSRPSRSSRKAKRK